MGGAVNRATRIFRMYNIDNRVEKVLKKDKPTPAPHYPADQQFLQSTGTESKPNLPIFLFHSSSSSGNIAPKSIHKKDEHLLENLHDVKVYSSGENPVIRRVSNSKPPLLNRLEEPLDDNSPDGAFGYVEPQRIPPGRVSLRQFLAYLQQHRDSPEEYSIDRFADMYTIKPETAEKLFKYHSLLALQEISRQQSKAPARPPHIAAAEVFNIEAEAARKPGPETGFTSKY
jgi:NADH dehydrogenase [ubiquinone] 1 alpha subcomplex assembly factor 4